MVYGGTVLPLKPIKEKSHRNIEVKKPHSYNISFRTLGDKKQKIRDTRKSR